MDELGLEKYPQYTTGKKLMLLGNKGIRTYEASIPSMSFLALLDVQRFLYAVSCIKNVHLFKGFRNLSSMSIYFQSHLLSFRVWSSAGEMQ